MELKPVNPAWIDSAGIRRNQWELKTNHNFKSEMLEISIQLGANVRFKTMILYEDMMLVQLQSQIHRNRG